MVFNKEINLDWFKENKLPGTLYKHLTGKEEQLTLNTPAAVFLKYTTDPWMQNYIKINSSNVNLTTEDVLKARNDNRAKANLTPLYILGDALKNR